MVFKSNLDKLLFYNFPVILFSLIPCFLITGPFLSDLSISLISLLFLGYCIKEKNFDFFKNKYFYFFLIFWGYLILNTLINNFNVGSFKISFFYFRYGVFVIAILTLIEVDDRFLKYFFYCIFICFLSLIVDGYYQYFNGENIFGYKMENQYRVTSFFGDEKILGGYLSRIWPIFFGLSLFFLNKKKKLFFLFIILFILSETLIFLSGERTAFFNINLSAIFIIFFSQRLLKLRLVTLVSSILLIILITFINPNAKERFVDHTIKQMNLNNDNEQDKETYIFSKEHHEIYISAYKMFLDNKILGVGVKNYRNFCSDPKYYVNEQEVCNTHPHNTYIQMLSETGIIGFLFLLAILIYFLYYTIKHLILKFKGKYLFTDFEICILSGIAIYLWPFVPTGNIFSNWLNIIMILNLPLLIWSRNSNKINIID